MPDSTVLSGGSQSHNGGGHHRPSELIVQDVEERLSWSGGLDTSGVTVRAEDGEVILEGTVDSRPVKRMVEDLAESVAGVVDVHNRLRIRRRDEVHRTAGGAPAGPAGP